MRLSRLFGHTLREVHAEGTSEGLVMAIRAGFLRPTTANTFHLLPLGAMTLDRIRNVVATELSQLQAQPLVLAPIPCTDSASQSRSDSSDRALMELLRSELDSYRQLPLLLWNAQAGPEGHSSALGRSRAGVMTLWSVSPTENDLHQAHGKMHAALERISTLCGIGAVHEFAADLRQTGRSQQLAWLFAGGRVEFVVCERCGYRATAQAATVHAGPTVEEDEHPLQEVSTPDCRTIDQVAGFLGETSARTIKAVLYTTDAGEVVMCAIRGDRAVNPDKVAALLRVGRIRPSSEDELQQAGVVAGFASPVGLGIRVIADNSLRGSKNLIAGANRAGYHLTGVNYGRDWTAQLADIVLTAEGSPCPVCESPLAIQRGITLVEMEQMGTSPAEEHGVNFQDVDGRARAPHLARYRIHIGHLMTAALEQSRDERGLVLPRAIAPFEVHLISLGKPQSQAAHAADSLYDQLEACGVSVLYDDRIESAGSKFADADLIGLPWRVVVSNRTVEQESAEVRHRGEESAQIVRLAELPEAIRSSMNPNSR